VMYRLLHISITPIYEPVNRAALEARLSDLGRDWLCYSAFSFVLWTNKSIVTVSEMIATHLQPVDQLLVFAISTTETPSGRLPHWVWEWINRPRNAWTGDILTPALPAPSATNLFDPSNPWLLPPSGNQ
jgi:nitrate/nitrite transporter NarK